MFKVTQLPGHQGAKCSSRWVVAYSLVLTILLAGLCISIFQVPVLLFLHLTLLCLIHSPVLRLPICFPSGLSTSLAHSICLPFTPALSLSHLRFLQGHPKESGHSEVPGDDRGPAVHQCPSALCFRQEGWAKGRGGRPQQPNLELWPRSGWV